MLDVLPPTRLDAAQHDAIGSLTSRCAPCCGNAPTRWCAVYTHPQTEAWADQNLTRLGFVSFLPTMVVSRRDRVVRSMRHTVTVPLFARYLFVAHDTPTFWRPIREAPGVASVVTSAGQVQYASPGAIEALQATQHVRHHPVAVTPSWAPGTPCSLAAGPMGGQPAVVLNAEGDQVQIGVMFLGQIRQISVAPECLVSRGDTQS